VGGRARDSAGDGAGVQPRTGERSYDMPPLRMIQDSGILWGFHTDTNEVNQYNPFYTLWFAVTGKMVGGKVVNHQTITREEALIAHTRSNSFFVMRRTTSARSRRQAGGSRRDGQDYLTIPADQIKDIKPVMTVVGGRSPTVEEVRRPRVGHGFNRFNGS
jgi:predicted amidohydrolase YtcJ